MPAVSDFRQANEEALTFSCGDDTLFGMLHHGADNADLAVLTIVAGGPQYRGGVGRQLVFLGRELAARGIPVLRFDHRGMGDSDGKFRGFEDMDEDLQAAIDALHARLPTLKRIVLWGGCDAASAVFINAHKYPSVVAITVANPWITDEKMAQRVQRQHFLKRLGELSFWKKVVTLQYNPVKYLATAQRKRTVPAAKPTLANEMPGQDSPQVTDSFVDRMRQGLEKFDGELFLLMSGRSLISRQFDELLAADSRWQRTINARLMSKHEVADADQTFSGLAAGREMRDTVIAWVEQLRDQR